ncbi:MAG: exo-beta-N-acetylmuramidase NamZ family protein [Bacteroidota bacterium]
MKWIIGTLFFISIAFGQHPAVKVGADVLFESKMDVIKGKRIGLVTNHTAVLSNGDHLADVLHSSKHVTLAALFGPEHGVRGDAPDGRTIRDTVDAKTGVPVYSLYGRINKPTSEMLKNVDVLLFDIQDVGARFYTFISTMFLCMEAAAENNIPFVVLDRPNPITGNLVGGPMRVDSLKTFVGWVPIPIAHGMTVGELALMANNEGWLNEKKKADLTVIRMDRWKRSMWYDETSLKWIKPSPNMATLTTAIVYPGLCLIEGINVSEGRGTEKPFEYIGAPWIDGKKLADYLRQYNLPGVTFESIEFTPMEIPNVASNPKYKGKKCGGVYVKVSNRTTLNPVKTGIAVVAAIHALYPDSLKFRDRGFDRLAGTPKIREEILKGTSVDAIVSSWSDEVKEFSKKRIPSLLYFD